MIYLFVWFWQLKKYQKSWQTMNEWKNELEKPKTCTSLYLLCPLWLHYKVNKIWSLSSANKFCHWFVAPSGYFITCELLNRRVVHFLFTCMQQRWEWKREKYCERKQNVSLVACLTLVCSVYSFSSLTSMKSALKWCQC